MARYPQSAHPCSCMVVHNLQACLPCSWRHHWLCPHLGRQGRCHLGAPPGLWRIPPLQRFCCHCPGLVHCPSSDRPGFSPLLHHHPHSHPAPQASSAALLLAAAYSSAGHQLGQCLLCPHQGLQAYSNAVSSCLLYLLFDCLLPLSAGASTNIC